MSFGKYVDEFGRTWQGPIAFTKEAVGSSTPPKATGVYQVLYVADAKPAVAYIGVATDSNHLRKRLLEHIRDSSNWALARIQDPSKFRIVFFPCDTLTARQIETYVITHRKPPFNVRPEYKNLVPSIAVH